MAEKRQIRKSAHRTGNRSVRMRNTLKILSAAEKVFAEKGFDGATTQQIADIAKLPKSNVHYYFKTKRDIYLALMQSIMAPWLESFQAISVDDDPGDALAGYVKRKVMLSRERPLASRIFANEMIRGAPVLSDFLRNELRKWVEEKTQIVKQWSEKGKMDDVSAAHLFIIIWAATQTYADFEVQIKSVLGRQNLETDDYDAAAELITRMVLRGCGIHGDHKVNQT